MVDKDGAIIFDLRQYSALMKISEDAPDGATHFRFTWGEFRRVGENYVAESRLEYCGDEFEISFGRWMPLIPIVCPKCNHSVKFPNLGPGRLIDLECGCGFKLRFESGANDLDDWYDID